MKLLFVIPEWGPVAGGIATYYRYLVPELRRAGHTVDLRVGSAYSQFESPPADEPGVLWLSPSQYQNQLDRFARFAMVGDLQRHLAAAWALREMAPAGAYDLVECCDWGLGFLPWSGGSIPLLVRMHASLSQVAASERLPGSDLFCSLTALLESLGLGRAAGIATYSEANAGFWSRRLGREVCMQRPAYPAGEPVRGGSDLIAGGRIQLWKGIETLCQALRQVPDISVRWFGRDMPVADQGQRRSYARVLRGRYPDIWGSSLLPMGQVSPAELEAARDGAGGVVVPSLWDVFNFTAIEAMAAGLPVIVSRGAGAGELIEHSQNGLLFESGNADELAAALRQWQSLNPSQRKQMGTAAIATVAECCDVANQAEAHLQLYRQVSEQPVSGHPSLAPLLESDTADSVDDLLHNSSIRQLAGGLSRRVLQKLRWRS